MNNIKRYKVDIDYLRGVGSPYGTITVLVETNSTNPSRIKQIAKEKAEEQGLWIYTGHGRSGIGEPKEVSAGEYRRMIKENNQDGEYVHYIM